MFIVPSSILMEKEGSRGYIKAGAEALLHTGIVSKWGEGGIPMFSIGTGEGWRPRSL